MKPMAIVPKHDVWVIAALSLAPAIGLGVARFGYSLILPDMQIDLNWSYSTSGWLNTTNALGYIIGALLTARVAKTIGNLNTTSIGVLLSIISLFYCGLVRDPIFLNVSRCISGIGGGFTFVAGGAIAAEIAGRSGRGSFSLGVFYAGPGIGMLLAGFVPVLVLDAQNPALWPNAWFAMGALAIVFSVGFFGFYSYYPNTRLSRASQRTSTSLIRWLLLGYGLFGAGYISFMTFMVVMIRDQGGSSHWQLSFWAALSIGVIASPFVWSPILDRIHPKFHFSFLCAVTCIGSLLPLLFESPATLLLSSWLFGSAFFGVAATITGYTRRNFPTTAWPKIIGIFTFSFGAGQMVGPIGTGLLADFSGTLTNGLLISALFLAAGATIGLLQQEHGLQP